MDLPPWASTSEFPTCCNNFYSTRTMKLNISSYRFQKDSDTSSKNDGQKYVGKKILMLKHHSYAEYTLQMMMNSTTRRSGMKGKEDRMKVQDAELILLESKKSDELTKTTTMMNHSTTKKPSFSILSHFKYEHLLAGISGGAISTLILHPLDLMKIRFAVSDGRTTIPQYSSLTSAFHSVVRQEGVKGLYRGVAPNVWGSGSAWGFYFLFYNSIKNWIQQGDSQYPLGPSLHMLAAAEAGILTLVVTNPIWVVKTRLCLQYGNEDTYLSKGGQFYRGMSDALVKIYQKEGVRGLYRGFVPGMFGVTHGALQFMTYEEMKGYYNGYRKLPLNNKLTTGEYLGFAAISKLIAAAATYPYQVIRARLQDQHHTYEGTWDCIKKTWKFERMGGFYKGLAPYLLHVTPNICLVMLIYEKFTNNN